MNSETFRAAPFLMHFPSVHVFHTAQSNNLIMHAPRFRANVFALSTSCSQKGQQLSFERLSWFTHGAAAQYLLLGHSDVKLGPTQKFYVFLAAV